MSSPFNIVFIHQDGLITGSLLSLIQMIEGFEKGKVKITVILLNDGPAKQKLTDLGIQTIVHHGRTFWTTPGPKLLQKATIDNLLALLPDFKLRKKIITLKPDIVHLNDKAAINAGISLLGSGIPIVQHLRSTYYICASKIHKAISILSLSITSDQFIAIGYDEAIGFNKSKTSIIHNSISEQEIQNAISNKIKVNPDKLHIGWVGQFTFQKGAWDFLEVAAQLAKKNKSIHFHLVAKLPNETQLSRIQNKTYYTSSYIHEYIERHELSERITLYGYRSDYLTIMAAMDIMICCNRLGTTGRQAFESICLGIPMIATSKHPEKNMINQLAIGHVVKEGNFEALLDTTEYFIHDTNQRIALKSKAYQIGLVQFNALTQSNKVLNIYQKIVP